MCKSYISSKLYFCALSNGNKFSVDVFKGMKQVSKGFFANGQLPIRQYNTTLVGATHLLQLKSGNCYPATLLRKCLKSQQRCFRTTAQRNALPPLLVMILGRVANAGAVIFGRTVRRWWKKLPPEEKVVYASKIRRNRYIIGGMFAAIAAGGSFVYYETHVQETPITNRKRFLAFTPDQMAEMSKLDLVDMLKSNEKNIIPASMQNPMYRRAVNVAQRLLNANRDLPVIQSLEWTVTVVDKNAINAFVMPCGSIFIYTGMLKFLDNDDQLGFILGHEMAHAILGHTAEKVSLMHFVDMMLVIPLAAIWALMPNDLIAAFGHFIKRTLQKILTELPHSRFVEEEADKVGMILAAKACFDVREAPVVWAKMKVFDNLVENENLDMVEIETEQWLSTHPSHEKRQAVLEELLPAALELREKVSCPTLPSSDPTAPFCILGSFMKFICKIVKDR